MKFLIDDKVRRPIGVKILGITLVLLLLMGVVTHSSNSNLKQLNSELSILSEYYIPLDQSVSDLRVSYLTQIMSLERVLSSRPKQSLDMARQEGEKFAKEMPSCSREDLRAARRKARQAFPSDDQYGIVVYELQKHCTDKQINASCDLVEKALAMPTVQKSPELMQKFTKLQGQLAGIPKLRNTLHTNILKYLSEMRRNDPRSLAILEEQLDVSRRAIGRETGGVARLLHTYTQQAAAKARALERQAFRFNWGMTFAAAMLGFLFAVLLTRNLVRPLRQLLTGAKAIEEGNLNIQVQVKSADEIALLADSFNYMVSGLKEKETIKETFGKYIDPRIVRTLLDGQSFSQGGEKRSMTVFFSDIQGFTRLSEQLTPDGVVRLLNHYISAMSEPIRNNHGIIDKYIGDAIMAFWGPPFTDEKVHPVLACYAAIEQQLRLEQFRKTIPDIIGLRKGLPDFNVRMAICTGDVIVGTIGAESAKSYTVIGDTVNLASRLETANKIYGTSLIISGDTFDKARDQIEARELDIVRVVGKSEPVQILELLGHKGGVSQMLLEIRDNFEKGLALYRQKDWAAARGFFETCLKLNPDDAPSKLFISRLEVFQSDPPDNDWNGIWNLSEK